MAGIASQAQSLARPQAAAPVPNQATSDNSTQTQMDDLRSMVASLSIHVTEKDDHNRGRST